MRIVRQMRTLLVAFTGMTAAMAGCVVLPAAAADWETSARRRLAPPIRSTLRFLI